MDLRCTFCQTMFALSRDDTLAALEHMEEHHQTYYDAHCPRCRRANRVERFKLEFSYPNWREVLAAKAKEAPAAAPVVTETPAPAPEPTPAPEPVAVTTPVVESAPRKKHHKPAATPSAKPVAKKAAPPSKKAPAPKGKPAAKKAVAKKVVTKPAAKKTAAKKVTKPAAKTSSPKGKKPAKKK